MARNFATEMAELQNRLTQQRLNGVDWRVQLDTETEIDDLEGEIQTALRAQVAALGLTPTED